jgi:hypothetical protein
MKNPSLQTLNYSLSHPHNFVTKPMNKASLHTVNYSLSHPHNFFTKRLNKPPQKGRESGRERV